MYWIHSVPTNKCLLYLNWYFNSVLFGPSYARFTGLCTFPPAEFKMSKSLNVLQRSEIYYYTIGYRATWREEQIKWQTWKGENKQSVKVKFCLLLQIFDCNQWYLIAIAFSKYLSSILSYFTSNQHKVRDQGTNGNR